MHAAKRPVSLPISGEGVQNKRKKAVSQTATSTSMSPSIGSGSSNNPCARDMLHSERPQRVTVFTQYSEINFFRGLPWLPADAMPYMEVITVNTAPPPHPLLPKSTPSHLKQVYQQCTRAAKMAWISESGLAAFPDDLMTDNHQVVQRCLSEARTSPEQPSGICDHNFHDSPPVNRTLPSESYLHRLDR